MLHISSILTELPGFEFLDLQFVSSRLSVYTSGIEARGRKGIERGTGRGGPGWARRGKRSFSSGEENIH